VGLPAAESGGADLFHRGMELVRSDAKGAGECFEALLHPLLDLLAVGPVLAGGVALSGERGLDLIAGDVAAELLSDGIRESRTVGPLAAGVVLDKRPADRFHRIGELLWGHAQLGCGRFESLKGVGFEPIAKLLKGLFDPLLGDVEGLRETSREVAHAHSPAIGAAHAVAMRPWSATSIAWSGRCRRGR
jgi:hypothetical protein